MFINMTKALTHFTYFYQYVINTSVQKLHTIETIVEKYLHICIENTKTAIIFVKNNRINISLWQQ
jgi:hypothetical protein